MKTTEEPVLVEEIFQTDINLVWKSITDKDEMIKWFFQNIPAFKPEVGFETTFKVESGERIFPHVWKIKEVKINELISYYWSYTNYAGLAVVNFKLEQINKEVKLSVLVEVLEDFDDSIPEFKRESCVGGWEYFINGQLKNYINSL